VAGNQCLAGWAYDIESGWKVGRAVIPSPARGQIIADMPVDSRANTVRFGPFELDARTDELRRNGVRIRLQGQPIQILVLLLERPGELVTQEEIREELWPDGTIVEYEHSIKTALRKLRHALGDEVEAPRYIETLPSEGIASLVRFTRQRRRSRLARTKRTLRSYETTGEQRRGSGLPWR
jgi:DNA-binding winged helix-turn-helix (wHTH) protein